MNEAIREQLSAYVDGELPDNEAELLIRRISQDAELRSAVAEYLAIGRLIRGDAGLAAADRLHERVAAALDDEAQAADSVQTDAKTGSRMKPLAGMAIAASVALAALFALQLTSLESTLSPDALQADSAPATVPTAASPQEMQREMLLRHAEATSDLGANGINSRLSLIALEFDEALEDSLEDRDEPVAEDGADDTGSDQ